MYNAWEPQTEVIYGLAVEAYRRAGAKILNLTPGTALTTVPIDKMRNWS
jgi:hypothetical protein